MKKWIKTEFGRWLNMYYMKEVDIIKRGDNDYWLICFEAQKTDKFETETGDYIIKKFESEPKAKKYLDKMMEELNS